ncbi:heterokaryon incompatibility protein-domain-containing protein [Phaeosphaeriaceae sp. PMI808]|nr:heterokaryon incompatibility protein-domain-containing protein [Phaeosphaeriaceae sp. PMI808]
MSNLAQHKERILISDLLPAYQDAISVTRRLGLQYLWIDSLCIVQDDIDDMRTQISNMGRIYQNSYLTIAADGFKDHTQSLFSQRKWNWRAHQEVMINGHGSSHKLYFRERPSHPNLSWDGIFSRGWCFQERLLSKRVVRFQASEVIYECNEALTCECGNPPAGHQGPWENLSQEVHLHDKVAFDYMLNRSPTSESWHHLVYAYSQTHLTFEEDRMNAFAGIVGLFRQQSSVGSQYLAGMWSKTLWEDMLWAVVCKDHPNCGGTEPRSHSTIPSWSWMSITLGNHHIVHSKLHVQQTFPRLMNIHYVPQSVHLPLGTVAPGAYLEIEGQLTPVSVADGRLKIIDFWAVELKLVPRLWWDPERQPCSEADNEVFLLRMAYLHDEPIVKEVFLILRSASGDGFKANTDTPCFTRVGYLEISKEEDSSSLEGLRIEEEYQILRLY